MYIYLYVYIYDTLEWHNIYTCMYIQCMSECLHDRLLLCKYFWFIPFMTICWSSLCVSRDYHGHVIVGHWSWSRLSISLLTGLLFILTLRWGEESRERRLRTGHNRLNWAVPVSINIAHHVDKYTYLITLLPFASKHRFLYWYLFWANESWILRQRTLDLQQQELLHSRLVINTTETPRTNLNSRTMKPPDQPCSRGIEFVHVIKHWTDMTSNNTIIIITNNNNFNNRS